MTSLSSVILSGAKNLHSCRPLARKAQNDPLPSSEQAGKYLVSLGEKKVSGTFSRLETAELKSRLERLERMVGSYVMAAATE